MSGSPSDGFAAGAGLTTESACGARLDAPAATAAYAALAAAPGAADAAEAVAAGVAVALGADFWSCCFGVEAAAAVAAEAVGLAPPPPPPPCMSTSLELLPCKSSSPSALCAADGVALAVLAITT